MVYDALSKPLQNAVFQPCESTLRLSGRQWRPAQSQL